MLEKSIFITYNKINRSVNLKIIGISPVIARTTIIPTMNSNSK